MSHDMVRLKMGGEGVRTLIRFPASGETSGVDYPSSSFDVYVQYDHRIDRRPPARAVLVRASMVLSTASVQALVDRFGPPHAGADDLEDGLQQGAAVWVDEPCGVVLTAYRPPACWWTAEGGAILQVETLELARKGGSPASSSLNEILARKNANPIDSAPPSSVPVAAIPPTTDPAASAPPADPVRPATQPLRTMGSTRAPSDKPAERIASVPAVYPAKAKWLGMKGHVTLAIVVRADGTVADRMRVVAVHPTGRGFEEAAVHAVRMWRYNPAVRRGKPVESNLTIGVDFD
jgi:protein TonB